MKLLCCHTIPPWPRSKVTIKLSFLVFQRQKQKVRRSKAKRKTRKSKAKASQFSSISTTIFMRIMSLKTTTKSLGLFEGRICKK
jgi:hypothetical protein